MNPLNKKFKLGKEAIQRLIPNMGACLATDRITVDGCQVGYMYREEPDNEVDSGWRFLAGDESQEYVDIAANWTVYDVNTICNYDQAIIPYLGAPNGSSFGRMAGTDIFEPEDIQDGGASDTHHS
jgi:hypothetical protein